MLSFSVLKQFVWANTLQLHRDISWRGWG